MVEASANVIGPRKSFTIKTLLRPLLGRRRVSQVIKWAVYSALIINFGVYLSDDWLAYRNSLAADAPWAEVIETFSTTIDMAGWLGLVLIFELETYALPDEKFKGWVTGALSAGRLFCYASIGYAVYGYTADTLGYYSVEPIAGVTSLCQLADQETALQISSIEYVPITRANCASLSAEKDFYQVEDQISVIDWPTIEHARTMGWIDVLNALVWLAVIFLIEIEVRLQSADRFSGRALTVARQAKTALYGVLIVNGLIWIVSGYPIYAWDAFLWIFGFWAIELNLADWEQQRLRELAQRAPGAAPSAAPGAP